MKELQTMREWYTRFCFIVILSRYKVLGTIDVNLNELEYLAARLKSFECRRLLAALHYTAYELPNNVAAAERNIDDEIPCMRHLLHWNSSPAEGKGKTHEVLAHRLRQINRDDLADWLGKSAFKQLGTDLGRAMVKPFGELGKEETDLPYPITLEPAKHYEEDDPWLQVDIVLMAVLLGMLGTLVTLICVTILHKIKQHFHETKYKKLKQQESEDEEQRLEKERITKKYEIENTSEVTDYTYTDDDTN
ncbi:hypothetical protein ANTPLA_LOCUS3924 [Anthophora plagiata]